MKYVLSRYTTIQPEGQRICDFTKRSESLEEARSSYSLQQVTRMHSGTIRYLCVAMEDRKKQEMPNTDIENKNPMYVLRASRLSPSSEAS